MNDWAMRRARELAAYHSPLPRAELSGQCDGEASMIAFAAYIREHEQPTEDPDVIEVRRLISGRCLRICSAEDTIEDVLDVALAALKRGRELERGK